MEESSTPASTWQSKSALLNYIFNLSLCFTQHLNLFFPLCQLLRKRHIGNDIVTIVFQEPGALPFTPKNIRSHFQHVFVIVKVHNPCTDNVCYR